MPDTPLNPDALEAAAKALRDDHANRTQFYVLPAWEKTPHESKELFRAKANAAVSAYLAAAQPVVDSVEELDALPKGSVFRAMNNWIWEVQRVGYFITTGMNGPVSAENIHLPARVLCRPSEQP